MNAPHLGALLCLGLLASCQSEINSEISPIVTETPAGFSVAKLTLDKVP
ncbi:MAG: hypothetical protein ACI9D0_000579 [Bacteroidia bacterium]|jgi:hypothetical protein